MCCGCGYIEGNIRVNKKSSLSRRGVTRAVERNEARRKQASQLVRTILLGCGAMVAGVFWVGDQYDVSREVIIEFLLTSLAFVAGLAVCGFLAMLLLRLFKRLFGR